MNLNRKTWNGRTIPSIGFGPGILRIEPGSFVRSLPASSSLRRLWMDKVTVPRAKAAFVRSIASGIECGFRLLDFSAAYGNGPCIGDAIVRSGLSRSDLFLTGRITNRAQREGPEAVLAEFEQILRDYRTDYVDLLMFHWPVTDRYVETWKVICDLYREGRAETIGVANCHPHHLEKLMEENLKPMVNQVEVHPLFTQKELIGYCRDRGILVEAYTPIARFDDRLMRLPALHRIAERHGKTSVQVVLRWHIQQGRIPVIRSLNRARQREDFDVFDFELSEEELGTIDGFNIDSRLRYDPDNCDFSIL